MAGTDSVLNIRLNTIMDISDVKHNVDEIQKSFSRLKLPDKLSNSLRKNIDSFNKEYTKYQDKIAEGIQTPADNTAVNKSLNSMLSSYEKIINEFSKMSQKDFKEIFNLDAGAFKEVQSQIKQLQTNLDKIKLDPSKISKPLQEIKNLTSSKRLTKEGGILDRLIGSFKTNDFDQAKKAFSELEKYYNQYSAKMSDSKKTGMQTQLEAIRAELDRVENEGGDARGAMENLQRILNGLGSQGERELQGVVDQLNESKINATSLTEELKKQSDQEFGFNNEVKNIDRQIQSYFGLSQVIRKVGNIAKQAFQTVKELDAAMVETAVVTNFDVSDMWNMLPTYTEHANQLGSTIKDVYEAATLYYQQGLNQAQAMQLADETLKMARIGGLQAAEATDMMTAALRGFNMQINEMSAQRINDVYSKLAAITASDTRELGSAMERTASIANSAGMEFETTSAFLAQMIETTREAPENLGTAMKTIIARFQEMKEDPTKLVDSEGVAMDANRVDKALKTIGVNLMDTNGQFRKLDEVFLDISARWDGLSQAQQRYIATIAAGSRQQSRFIAMMQNHERVTELVEAANNSAGASQQQFDKTLEGMSAKLNMLKNAWDQFTMGLMNNQIIKFGVDRLTDLLTIVNKIIDTLGGKLPDPFGGIVKSVLTLAGTLGGLNLAKILSRGLIRGGVGWWKGETQKGLIGSIFGAMSVKPRAKDMNQVKTVFKSQLKSSLESEKITISPNIRFSKKNLIPGSVSSQLQAELDREFTEIAKRVHADINDPNKITAKEGADLFIQRANTTAAFMGEDINFSDGGKEIQRQLEGANKQLDAFDNRVTRAGSSLRQFSQLLMGTPLQPFGVILDKIGIGMELLGGTLTKVKAKFLEGAISTKVMATAEGEATVTSFSLAGGLRAVGAALLEALAPIAPLLGILAILATVGAGVYLELTKNERALKTAADAAGVAADTYSSAAQATSELKDNLEKLEEINSGFDGLVEGTAAFNEQLIKANELVLKLLEQYPLLYEYLTTDDSGRLIISDEGLEAVLDEQNKVLNNTAAMNAIKNGEYQAQLTQNEIDEKADERDSWKTSNEERDRLNQEIELLQKKKEAQLQSAHVAGISADLSGQELKNTEAITQLYSDMYDEAVKSAKLPDSKEEMYQMYADYNGYQYEGGKTLKDLNGEEITDIDYDDIKEAMPDIIVNTEFRANAESLDKTLNEANEIFKDNLSIDLQEGDNINTDTFFSDVIGKRAEANEQLINELRRDNTDIDEAIHKLNAEQVSTILQKDSDLIEKNLDYYQDQVLELFNNNMDEIASAQGEQYADLAAMMGEAKYGRTVDPRGAGIMKRDIEDELHALTGAQRQAMLETGTAIRDSVGRDSMAIMINGMHSLYTELNNGVSGAEDKVRELQNVINDVSWDSPTERLIAYNNMIDSSVEEISNMGKALMNSSDSADILTEAFGEMYTSDQFTEAMEDAEKFMDSTGRFTSAGVLEMSKSVGILNKQIDEGIFSLGGVAMALNAVSGEGNLTYLDLNDNVLKLMTSFAALDTVVANTQNTIENFDPGLDTGAGEDFIKEQTENFKKLYENGEWGNPQMEAYARLIVSESKWHDTLEKHAGDLEKTYEDLYSDIMLFSDGYYDAWAKMANGSNDSSNLVTWNDDGSIHLNLDNPEFDTTDEIVKYLEKEFEISKETAEAMLTDFLNYSGDLKKELSKNDFQAGLQDTSFFKDKTVDGQVRLTESEIQLIANGTGMSTDDVEKEIRDAAGETLTILDNIDDNTGEIRTDYANLNKEGGYSTEYLKQNYASTDNRFSGAIDANAVLGGLKNAGYAQEQTYGMLYEQFKEANEKGIQFEYQGELLKPEDFDSLDSFIEKLASIDETVEWESIGESIAKGFDTYEANKNKPPTPTPSTPAVEKPNASDGAPPGAYTDTGTGSKTKVTGDIYEPKEPVEVPYTLKSQEKPEQIVKKDFPNPLGVPSKFDFTFPQVTPPPVTVPAEFQPDTTEVDSTTAILNSLNLNIDTIFDATDNTTSTIESIESHDGNTINFNFTSSGLSSIAQQIAAIKASSKPAYTGLNNKISYTHVPEAGSLAKGTKKGRVGPRNQGGLTLTGEEGYEIAWIPSQSKSIILGANGPQMVNLPKEAVVYNHEQSKDILKNRSSIHAGSMDGGNAYRKRDNSGSNSSSRSSSSSSSSKSSSKGSSKSSSSDDKHQTINNWSIEEVIRFDAEKKIDNYQHKVDNWMKDLEKSLDKIGTRVSDVTSNLNNQIDYLKSVERQNNNLAASYQRSLNQIDKGNYKVTISYDKNGESQQEDVNLSPYIYKDQWDNYQIDKSKIAGAGSKARQEAIFKAAQSAIDPLVSGLQKAQDGARAARDAIEDLQKQIYNTFYGWENEITKIYNLTQKISNLTGMQERFITQVNLELTKLGVGYGSTIDSIVNITAVLNRNNDALVKTVKANKELIKARQEELANAISSTDELEHYTQVWKNAGRTMNDAGVQLAKQEWDAANMALSYISSKQFNEDGTIEIEINTKKFENDVAKGLISEKTYEAIKKHLDNIENAAKEVNNIIKDSANILVDYYNKLEEYQKTIGDFENILLKQLEDNLKTQIDNAKKLNNSLKNSLKNILDEVKRRLNERRQKEDNAQTEADIAKKQQQLAMLRANTSAGNKVEIARLEKEIADAQQSYQRTLEDQLLQKLQEQEDIAATQRERQIELLEAQLELDKERNRQLVTTWLKNPTQYQEEIRKLWLESQDYEDKGDYNREILEKAFDKAFTEYLNAATQSNFTSSLRSQLNIQQTIADRVKEIEDLLKFVTELNTNGEIGKTILNPHTAKYFKDNENSINEALKASESEGHKFTDKELVNGGYTIRDFIKAGIKDRQRLLNAGFDEKTVDQYVPKQKTSPKKTTSNSKTSSTTNKSTTPTKKTYSEHGGSLPSSYPGYFSSNYTTKIQQFLKAIGLYKDKVDGSYGPNTRSATKAFQKLVGLTVDGSFGPDTLKKAKLYKYKKGGLAPFTGPAWLDGTRSKPELVLNATDTKNFIQLKDILSSIMKGGVFDTAAAVAGDTNYEININVDHINNDYDVDKIANRVKKIIVQDSSYRNVTSVRKFR